MWTDLGPIGIRPEEAAELARETGRTVVGVYAPEPAVATHDLGSGSALAELARAGVAVPENMDPELVAALRRVPAGETLRLVATVARGASETTLGFPGGQMHTLDDPFGQGDCTGRAVVACATITIVIEVSGVGARCAFPCFPPFVALIPHIKFATTQQIDVVRWDRGIDALGVSSNHFRNDDGANWSHNFQVVANNPNQPGAGAHYTATSHGEWEPGYVEIVGVGVNPETTVISGFCMRWTVRYGSTTYSYTGGYQLRGDVVLGLFTGSQDVVQSGFCTLS